MQPCIPIGMAGKISPGGKRKNVFGRQLRDFRKARGLTAVEVVARLGVLGWDVAASSYSQIESGQRILGDYELLMILHVLEATITDLKIPKIKRL
jgi:transcriptional regulator with XRE-family HTH domain